MPDFVSQCGNSVEVVERNLIGFIFADGVRACDFQVVVAAVVVWMVPRYTLEATQPNVELGLYLQEDKFTSWQTLACPAA